MLLLQSGQRIGAFDDRAGIADSLQIFCCAKGFRCCVQGITASLLFLSLIDPRYFSLYTILEGWK